MNKTSLYEFTIVVPTYNEEEALPAFEKAMAEYLPKCTRKACVLFVNDGSKDRSSEILKDICARNEHFYYIEFAKNCGYSAVLKAGFAYAESELVGFIDADLQTTPEDFNVLLAEIDGCSLVTGIRVKRNDNNGLSRKLQSKIANGFRRMMTGDTAIDTCCPLKVIRTENAKQFPMFSGLHRFLPALVMLQEGGSFKQVPVRHFPRVAGTAKFNLWNRLLHPFFDCFAYRWMKRRYINYTIASTNAE